MPPPPPPDDTPPQPATPGDGWEVVDPVPPAPARDPILDDPLFADLVESKPLPELKAEPVAPPRQVAEPYDALPVAEEVPAPRAAPVRPPRPRPVVPPPPPAEVPRPRVYAACAVIGCFGLGLLAAIGFVAYAAILLLQGVADQRGEPTPLAGGVRPDPVAPTTLAGTKVISLPGTVDAVGRAAGGRFLLLRTPRTGEVHVFDPNVGEVIRKFEVGSGKVLFAGSAAKLFVYRPGVTGEELERWDLMSGRKELTEGRPTGVVQPDALVVGAGVDGPVYLVSVPEGGVANVRALDPATLKQRDGGSFSLPGWRGDQKTRVHVRASDDGTVLGVTTPGGAQLFRFAPGAAPTAVKLAGLAGQSPLLATPAADGQLAFTTLGMYDATGGRRRGTGTPYTFPPAHGTGLFLSYNRDPVRLTLDDPLRLHLVAHPDLTVELDGVGVPRGMTPTDAGDVPPDQRVHVWPAAGVAVVIKAGGNQQLDVRKVDVRKLLAGEIERPYLLVGSEPHLWALRGREWRYRAVAWTNVEGVPPTVTKVDGPPEMQVRDGELVWTPGATAPEAGASVTVRLQVEQLTAEQRFRVAVLDEPEGD